MSSTAQVLSSSAVTAATKSTPARRHVLLLVALWIAVYAAALFAPPLLDDADATHASAARNILLTHDFVTLRVDGIRYLEKAPLPYWFVASAFRIFGFNAFAVHLPQALGVLMLALLAYRWARRAWNERTALYAAMMVLTSIGVFLFTRVFIPEVLLSLFLAGTLYAFQRGLEERSPRHIYAAYALLALAVLTKGLIAIVFTAGALFLYGLLTGEWRRWRELRPVTGTLLFFAIAAPWHILAGLRNTGAYGGHGFFWFYFVNEHFMRFLGRRIPHDYNKLPGGLYWVLHLAWLFPWSLFFPAGLAVAWLRRGRFSSLRHTYEGRTILLLTSFAALILVFFSISTNQEYYTFPAYLPIAMLTAAGLTAAERHARVRGWITAAHAAFAVLGIAIAATLASGLWSSRHLPFVSDIGELLAHRGVGDYTLSMSHFFDLTGPSFAALRLPAGLAALVFAIGPTAAWVLRRRGHALQSTVAIALTSGVFLIAAHIALIRFAPMLSSAALAQNFTDAERTGVIAPGTQLMLYGDQAYGSTLPFYTGRIVPLVEGRSTSMWFGSTFQDAPHIFLSDADLLRTWGQGVRKVLFVPEEKRQVVDHLLGSRAVVMTELSGKALLTDRPLARP
ncbi:PMT family glycosyltransferase, 4-amino-4-deoxy-L-arabinose transferase [Terriglobus roseus DSM 18391]|uniref:PMT family glycosyltransferase, 4-amino-4-deoxy-L-arabinose transferase n=1 Tax=Terriglobus roseus (strain DSM 18391 / NRRL B-41598 / KBS 63) TaxID=926566 RepID=I3ZKL0_TERRK|nr:glycosyltransferase family 39 protein [Terriglobus roseus]AFL89778.1 PMT family glycosyltransferase, 4-amino-4-deoxy-L-arabinose transferase [Terriglobus roseus DSM 18391]